MKTKTVKALLVGVAAMAMVVNGVGCTPTEEKSPVQSEAVKEDPNETAVKELKKYIPKVNRLKVVQNAKNLDMTKAVTGLVDEKQKDKVASVKVDDSKLDETKPGTYAVTVTVTLKDDNSKTTPDSAKASTKEDAGKTEDNTGKAEETSKDTAAKDDTSAADKDTPVKEDTAKPETSDKEDTGKTEDSNGAVADKEETGTDADSKEDTSKEDNTISGTVDVEIVDKDKVEDLTGKGDVVITDDNKVVESDKPAEDKKEDDKDKKPDNDKKPETDKNSKPSKEEKPDNNSQSTNKPVGGSSNNSNNNQQSHTHSWVQQYTTVYHEEVGHSEQVWVVDAQAWDEPVYEWRTICNGCGADITNEDAVLHSSICRASYRDDYIQVGTTHHDEVGHYESKWVVDSQAWTETVPNGYSCSGCGATK